MTKAMLTLALVLVVAVDLRAAAPPATRAATTAPAAGHEVNPAITAFMRPIETAPGDDPVRQKLKERHNTAVRLLEVRVDGYRKGMNDVNSVFEAGRLVADAKVDLAQSVKERDAIVEQLLEVTKEMESELESQWKSGLRSEADVLRARLARQTVEVDLLKLQRASAPNMPTTQP